MRPRGAVAASCVAAATVAGCGLGAGKGADGVSVTVTRDFGARTVGTAGAARAPGEETVMRFLQRRFRVRTRFSGGFVQSVNGISGELRGARRTDWFFYVNGIEASQGAASTRLHPGDRVWWDHHDWGSAISIPAVVGSFPEPFRSGTGGRRLPVTTACAPGVAAACEEARGRLRRVGVPLSSGTIGAPLGDESLRLLVGTWAELRGDLVARLIDGGPGVSGVFARFDRTGRRLNALDARGRTVRTLGPGTGLVAATREHDQKPTWVVTGTDAAGVMAAARALEEGALADHFALAVAGGAAVRLPSAPAAEGGAR